jgi:serine/threonine protein kinase
LRRESTEGNNDMNALFSEIAVLKQIDHPNIMRLYELFQDEVYYYLVTEYPYSVSLTKFPN